MKYIIQESKILDVAFNWLDKNYNFNQLMVSKHPRFQHVIIYRKDGRIVMEQDVKNKDFYFSYDEIWSFLENFFGMRRIDVQNLLTKWLQIYLEDESYTPLMLIPRP